MKDKMATWIKKQVKAAGARGCVLGLSGGIDSAVVGALCVRAFPDNTMGLIMPCFSRAEDLQDAKIFAERFSLATKLIDLKPAFRTLYLQVEGKPYSEKIMNLAVANLKPRLRMITLYYYANKLNYLVVGTGNKSEAVMGYSTKYGDGGVDLLPLGALLKTQVRALAEELAIPPQILDKPPSAGLWPGQTDEAEMGITYAELDQVIAGIEKNDLTGLDAKQVKKVRQKIKETEHKRCLPPVFQS